MFHSQPFNFHSIQTTDFTLSDDIHNNLDIRQIKLKTRREEAIDPATNAICDRRLDELEENRTRRKELGKIKAGPSLARVATVYCGEFGYVPESLALLPAATSDPCVPSQHTELFESVLTIAELRVKPMISID
jgi:hypothetical protein